MTGAGGSTQLSERVRTLLRGANFAFLATTMPDGSPHVAPVWVDLDESDRVVVNSWVGTRKERNARRDPRVALSVADRGDPYEKVDVRGRVVAFEEGPGALDQIRQLGIRYTGVPYEQEPGDPPLVVMRIEVERVFEESFPELTRQTAARARRELPASLRSYAETLVPAASARERRLLTELFGSSAMLQQTDH